MSSLLNSEMISLEVLQVLSYEERVIYAGVMHSLLIENFKDLNYLNQMPLEYIKDINQGLEEIIDIFIELELVDYLEDILKIREGMKKSIEK